VVDGIYEDYSDTFLPIYYHLSGSAAQSWCGDRHAWYGSHPAPNLWFDGSVNGGSDSGTWENEYLTQQQVPTGVTISLQAFRDGASIEIHASVCRERGGRSDDLRIYFVQVLDHFPADESYYRFAFRQVFSQDISLPGGACVDVTKSMSVKSTDLDQPEDIGIVVWAEVALDEGPAEIEQTAWILNPPPKMIHQDGFENGDLSAWDASTGSFH